MSIKIYREYNEVPKTKVTMSILKYDQNQKFRNAFGFY